MAKSNNSRPVRPTASGIERQMQDRLTQEALTGVNTLPRSSDFGDLRADIVELAWAQERAIPRGIVLRTRTREARDRAVRNLHALAYLAAGQVVRNTSGQVQLVHRDRLFSPMDLGLPPTDITVQVTDKSRITVTDNEWPFLEDRSGVEFLPAEVDRVALESMMVALLRTDIEREPSEDPYAA